MGNNWVLRAGAIAAVIGMVGFAHAATTPAEQAAEMLARANSINGKCNYLNAANKAHLGELVHRAEKALSSRESADAAKAAIERGHAEGVAAACSASEKANLHTILDAAKEASLPEQASTKALPMPLKTPPPAVRAQDAEAPTAKKVKAKPIVVAEEPVDKPEPKPIVKMKSKPRKAKPVVEADEPVEAPPPVPEPMRRKVAAFIGDDRPATLPRDARPTRRIAQRHDGGLQVYAQMTHDYYLARRCAPGDTRNLGGLYQQILATHDNLMRDHPAGMVASVLRRSARTASNQGC